MKRPESAKNREQRLSRQRKWYRENRTRIKERDRKYYDENKGQVLKKRKEWAERNQDKIRNAHLIRTYGLTIEKYNELYHRQDELCAICKKRFPRLHVDHDHVTNMVRGLLCVTCNLGIGHFKDNHLLLENAIFYLRNAS